MYILLQASRRKALLLTAINAYSRKVLTYTLCLIIKKGNVFIRISLPLMEYNIEGIALRNNN